MGATGAFTCAPQLPQNGPETGEPQLEQNVGIGRFYSSNPWVTTEDLPL
jgi:hypothetical protein